MTKPKKATVVHVVDRDKTLMGDHTKSGTLRGYGGMMEYGETWQECTCREMKVEGGIIIYPDELIPVALIDYYNGDETEVPFGMPSIQVLFCITKKYDGLPISTPEMKNPYWYPFGRGQILPYAKMAVGDDLVIPTVLITKVPTKGFIRRNKEKTKVLQSHLPQCDPSELVMLPLIEEVPTPPKIYR